MIPREKRRILTKFLLCFGYLTDGSVQDTKLFKNNNSFLLFVKDYKKNRY